MERVPLLSDMRRSRCVFTSLRFARCLCLFSFLSLLSPITLVSGNSGVMTPWTTCPLPRSKCKSERSPSTLAHLSDSEVSPLGRDDASLGVYPTWTRRPPSDDTTTPPPSLAPNARQRFLLGTATPPSLAPNARAAWQRFLQCDLAPNARCRFRPLMPRYNSRVSSVLYRENIHVYL
jgi:hypothetical protein